MTRKPKLDSLRVFEVAARRGNFRLAAEELHLTQSAVAQRIRQLEATLGVALFVREPRGLTPTEVGRRYLTDLQPALAMIDEATRRVAWQDRPLTLSVTPSFAAKWLMPRLGDFREAHPGLDLKLEASERLADFVTDGVDFAIRQGRPPFGEGLHHERLTRLNLCVLCSPAYLARQGGAIDLSDLSAQTLSDDVHGLWQRFTTQLPGQAQARRLRFSHTSLAIDAALSGQGIVLAPRLLVAQHLAREELAVLAALPDDDEGFYLVFPEARLEEARRVLLPWLSAQLDPAR
ncbi:LysR substrate-binding domain-containing protein [Halomonas sp. YLGW01]|uniref:LysR substrate-binding domain-containing protein n=1 Tax=Halomonas sp. YLGW01 TaxID=2773308 RepID=UPI0017821C77|nr:LysR substrate-binding domain-containing protein [Halomonas sp. YLGW01]